MAKFRFMRAGWRWPLMIGWLLVAVILTTQSSRLPFVGLITQTIGSTEFGATLGHGALFGLLTGFLYLALKNQLRRTWALPLAMAVSLALGTITELFQRRVAGRDSALADLLANWLGVFTVAFVIVYLWELRRSRPA